MISVVAGFVMAVIVVKMNAYEEIKALFTPALVAIALLGGYVMSFRPEITMQEWSTVPAYLYAFGVTGGAVIMAISWIVVFETAKEVLNGKITERTKT